MKSKNTEIVSKTDPAHALTSVQNALYKSFSFNADDVLDELVMLSWSLSNTSFQH